jgi:hypothetical protein
LGGVVLVAAGLGGNVGGVRRGFSAALVVAGSLGVCLVVADARRLVSAGGSGEFSELRERGGEVGGPWPVVLES